MKMSPFAVSKMKRIVSKQKKNYAELNKSRCISSCKYTVYDSKSDVLAGPQNIIAKIFEKDEKKLII